MADLIQSQPKFSDAEASEILRKHYGLERTVKPLESERDQNFLIDFRDVGKLVLKIANSQTDLNCLDLENKAMKLLYSTKLAPVIPKLQPSVNGKWIEIHEEKYPVRLISFIDGNILANFSRPSPNLLFDFGRKLGLLASSLIDFQHPAAQKEFHWDLDQFSHTLEQHKSYVADQTTLEPFTTRYALRVKPLLDQLRKSIIHNDANDHNIIVSRMYPEPDSVAGIIDFGDMVYSSTINELAIAIAYVMLDKTDPLRAASHVVRGFNESLPLTEIEFKVLFDLACARLCTSVMMAAYQRSLNPDNDYLSVTDEPAQRLLKQLKDVSPDFAVAFFRSKCGLSDLPKATSIASWVDEQEDSFFPLLGKPLSDDNVHVLDLSVLSSDPIAGDLGANSPEAVANTISAHGKEVGLGRYLEPRICYQGDQFSESTDPEDEPRTIHMGIDLFVEDGTNIYSPMDGRIHSFADNNLPFDYGPTIILEHSTDSGETFFSLYGHLSRESLVNLEVGQMIAKGQLIATIGSREVNGGWAPHLHFQIMSHDLELSGNYPGVAKATDIQAWKEIILNPCRIAGVPCDMGTTPSTHKVDLQTRRSHALNPSLSLSYKDHLHMVRGQGQYLFDADGIRYLDCVNNVCHVGHCHPYVAEAASKQLELLNTNTRYLHEEIIRYAERLTATLPDGLDVCYLVNSGSEANDLALRLARNYTQKNEVICVDGAYHGNLSSLIEISPYKFKSSGGKGKPDHIHMVPMPDPLRGKHTNRGKYKKKPMSAESTLRLYTKYAKEAIESSARTHDGSHEIAAFICESILSCGGQIELPEGYLNAQYSLLREHGVLCIADEVQVGFGRVGRSFWAFELQNVVPDIVTMGKPIGNGFPLGAVVTTREIADAFNNGMEYFNTYGGNPVSSSVGNAVLDVIENEGLQKHALEVGEYFLSELRQLQSEFPFIGDVRGQGLFLGIEFVSNPEYCHCNPELAKYVVERLKSMRILLSTDGPGNNVIKIKPPLVFDKSNVDSVIGGMRRIFQEDFPSSFLRSPFV